MAVKFFDPALIYSLKCYLFPAKGCFCCERYLDYYNQAYQLWHDVKWTALHTDSKLPAPSQLYSDDFIRQHEIIALFHRDVPVGLVTLDWMDFNCPSLMKRSYFINNYPSGVISKIYESMHRKVAIAEQLTVHHDWRKSKIGLGISEVLFGMAVLRFLETKATGLMSFTRNDRGTNQLCYRHGAVLLLGDHQSHGISSDIVLITRTSAHLSKIEGVETVTRMLWQGKVNTIQENSLLLQNKNMIKKESFL